MQPSILAGINTCVMPCPLSSARGAAGAFVNEKEKGQRKLMFAQMLRPQTDQIQLLGFPATNSPQSGLRALQRDLVVVLLLELVS